jgi:hypothetical protein
LKGEGTVAPACRDGLHLLSCQRDYFPKGRTGNRHCSQFTQGPPCPTAAIIDAGAKCVLNPSSILHFPPPGPESTGGVDIHQQKNL